MSPPKSLEGLLARAGITDAIYRAVTCLDRPNDELFYSAYTEDAAFEINGHVSPGRDAIYKSYKHVSQLDTTHFITNIRINHNDGDVTAEATASALAQHFHANHMETKDSANFLGGSLYDMKFAKEGDDWKIKYFKLTIVWYEGDYAVVRA